MWQTYTFGIRSVESRWECKLVQSLWKTVWRFLCCQVASVMFDSVRPHGLQPTGLLRPWDSPGKNTGVGCHFLFQCMKVENESEVAQSCLTLSDPMDCSLPGSSIHGIFQATVLEWGAIAFPMEISQETKNRFTMWPRNFTPGCISKNKNSNLKRHMHPNIHSNINYNCQDMEAT